MDRTKIGDNIGATVTRGASTSESMMIDGRYTMTCIGPDGKVKWEDAFDNLVTTEGKNYLLDQGIPAGTGTAARSNVNVFYRMSLITSGTPTVNDTYATHPGFTELGSGVVAARGSPVFSAASGGVKSATALSFPVIGTGDVIGAAINLLVGASVGNLGTVGNTAEAGAVLYSAGIFITKSVSSGDTVQVTYSTTLS